MRQFSIALRSFQDVQDFVEVATVQPFRVLVGNDRTRVNGKSFMGMFSLDLTQALQVRVECTDEQFENFRQAIRQFLAND